MRFLFFILLIGGLTFSGCGEDDPCENITCLNGGTCANGLCNCPDGYEGSDCSQEQEPVSIKITKVTVDRFPLTDSNGGGWDLTSGPDIVFGLYDAAGTFEYYYHPTQITNASLGASFNNLDVTIFAPADKSYNIGLWDEDDFDADDFMGGIGFTMYNEGESFPTTISLDAGGNVAFTLEVQYDF